MFTADSMYVVDVLVIVSTLEYTVSHDMFLVHQTLVSTVDPVKRQTTPATIANVLKVRIFRLIMEN